MFCSVLEVLLSGPVSVLWNWFCSLVVVLVCDSCLVLLLLRKLEEMEVQQLSDHDVIVIHTENVFVCLF